MWIGKCEQTFGNLIIRGFWDFCLNHSFFFFVSKIFVASDGIGNKLITANFILGVSIVSCSLQKFEWNTVTWTRCKCTALKKGEHKTVFCSLNWQQPNAAECSLKWEIFFRSFLVDWAVIAQKRNEFTSRLPKATLFNYSRERERKNTGQVWLFSPSQWLIS